MIGTWKPRVSFSTPIDQTSSSHVASHGCSFRRRDSIAFTRERCDRVSQRVFHLYSAKWVHEEKFFIDTKVEIALLQSYNEDGKITSDFSFDDVYL